MTSVVYVAMDVDCYYVLFQRSAWHIFAYIAYNWVSVYTYHIRLYYFKARGILCCLDSVVIAFECDRLIANELLL